MTFLKKINWAEIIFLPLAVMWLTGLSLYPWAGWLTQLAGQEVASQRVVAPTLVSLLAVLIVSALVTRLSVNYLPLRQARYSVLIGAALALSCFFFVHHRTRFPFGFLSGLILWGKFFSPELILLGCGAYLWWRGIIIGRADTAHDLLESAFYGGVLALGLFITVNRFSPYLAPFEVLWMLITFFAVGLGGLALASIERMRRRQTETTGGWVAVNRYWISTVVIVIGLVLSGALLINELLAPGVLERLARWLDPVWALLSPLTELLARAILIAMSVIFIAVFAVMEWLYVRFQGFKFNFVLPELNFSAEEAIKTLNDFLESPAVKVSGRGSLTFLILLGFALLILFALRRFWKPPRRNTDEVRESVLSVNLLLEQLRNLFKRPASASAPPTEAYFALNGAPDDPRLIIRRAYQGMLKWALEKGQARLPHHTPEAYARALAQAVPLPTAAALDTLTRLYVPTRYSATAPSLAEAREAEQAAQQIINNP